MAAERERERAEPVQRRHVPRIRRHRLDGVGDLQGVGSGPQKLGSLGEIGLDVRGVSRCQRRRQVALRLPETAGKRPEGDGKVVGSRRAHGPSVPGAGEVNISRR